MLSPRERLDAARELAAIAADAATVLMQGFRRADATPMRVEYKGAIDLVTEYDRASEDLIRARVAAAFPGCDVVAEEGGGSVRGDRPVVYADPLDGTTNFAHGHPFFAVSLGMLDADGELAAGVVVAPALGWTHTAARGHGAARNGARCAVSAQTALARALLATGFPYDRQTSAENNFRAFVEIKKRVQGVRRCGSASLDLCMVGDGTYDGYWERKLKPWDLAAGALVVLEAGGTLSGLEGQPADVRAGDLVASNGAIHGELLAALAAAAALPAL